MSNHIMDISREENISRRLSQNTILGRDLRIIADELRCTVEIKPSFVENYQLVN